MFRVRNVDTNVLPDLREGVACDPQALLTRKPMPNPFTPEHQQFRATVRSFCEKELAPHVAEWERDELFPNWVFKRAGELGIFGAHYPEEVGGAGGDYWFSVAKSEEFPRCKMSGVG